jgi:hypothetical protein
MRISELLQETQKKLDDFEHPEPYRCMSFAPHTNFRFVIPL